MASNIPAVFDEQVHYYSRAISIVQSSGTGMSRLVDEIRKEFVILVSAFDCRGKPDIQQAHSKSATIFG